MLQIDSILKKALAENSFFLSEEAIQKLSCYLTLLQNWNRAFNLTSVTKPQEMVYLHIIDSLMISSHLQGKRTLDVGSGAGLPGIPLAIVHPQTQWVLLDKNNKKTRFVTQVIAELDLKNVEVVHCRCEDFLSTACFDNILSRAFGTISLLIHAAQHLLCSDGIFLAMKGKYPQDEIAAIPDGFMIQNVTPLTINGIEVDRHLVCIRRCQT